MAKSNTNDEVLATATANLPTIDATTNAVLPTIDATATATSAEEPTMNDLKALISQAFPSFDTSNLQVVSKKKAVAWILSVTPAKPPHSYYHHSFSCNFTPSNNNDPLPINRQATTSTFRVKLLQISRPPLSYLPPLTTNKTAGFIHRLDANKRRINFPRLQQYQELTYQRRNQRSLFPNSWRPTLTISGLGFYLMDGRWRFVLKGRQMVSKGIWIVPI